MAMRQSPPVDLRTLDYMPSDLHLTFLDLELFAAGIAQLAPAFRGTTPLPGTPLSPSLSTAEPCSAVTKFLEDLIPFGGSTFGWGAGEAAKKAVTKYVEALSFYLSWDPAIPGAAAAAFSKFLEGLEAIEQIQALALLYTTASATIESLSDNPIHKPINSDVLIGFRLTAGVPDADWDQYKQQPEDPEVLQILDDCLKELGLPKITRKRDIGNDISTWRVRWSLVEGSPDHAQWVDASSFDFPGTLRNYLNRINDHAGQDVVAAQLTKEKTSDHPGDLKSAPVTVEASVQTDEPPDITQLYDALEAGVGGFIGLTDPLAELLAGLFQNLVTIDAYKTVMVQFHVPRKGAWTGVVNVVDSGVRSFTGSDDDPFQGTGSYSYSVSQQFYVIDSEEEGDSEHGYVVRLTLRAISRGEAHGQSTLFHRWKDDLVCPSAYTYIEQESKVIGTDETEADANIGVGRSGKNGFVLHAPGLILKGTFRARTERLSANGDGCQRDDESSEDDIEKPLYEYGSEHYGPSSGSATSMSGSYSEPSDIEFGTRYIQYHFERR